MSSYNINQNGIDLVNQQLQSHLKEHLKPSKKLSMTDLESTVNEIENTSDKQNKPCGYFELGSHETKSGHTEVVWIDGEKYFDLHIDPFESQEDDE